MHFFASSWPILAAVGLESAGDEESVFLNWVLLFLITMAIKLPMVLLAWRLRGCPGRLRPWLLASIAGNLLSHPLAVYIGTRVDLPAGGGLGMANYLIIESGVIMVEMWAFRFLATRSWTEAALIALAANAVTALLGAFRLFMF